MPNLTTSLTSIFRSTFLILKLTVFLILLSYEVALGNNYYFSNTIGDDSRTSSQAQNPVTPWKTITKLNSFFTSLVPGDSILFRSGETFYGSIKLLKSGTSTLPISIGAYSTGNKPIISGFVTLSGWTNEGNGIYSKAISCEGNTTNMVTVDDVNTGMGRYPNAGTWLTYESHNTTTSITDNQLTGSPNWTGAEVVIRKNDHRIDRCSITNHSSTTLSYTSLQSSNEGTDNYGYFIQNDLRTLDAFGEWFYNGSKFYMYFGTIDPSTKVVKIASVKNIIYDHDYSFIAMSGITIEGSIENAMSTVNLVNHITVQNCEIRFAGGAGIANGYGSLYHNINNNTIHDCAFSAYYSYSGNATVTNNIIYNIGLIRGAVKYLGGSYGEYNGINIQGNSIVQFNELYNIGANCIAADGDNAEIRNNYIHNFGLIVADMSAIYYCFYGSTIYNNIIIDGNIIKDGIVDLTGTPFYGVADYWAQITGIYLDFGATGITITNNTISGCNAGIKLASAYNNIIHSNTLYDNQWGIFLQEYNLAPLPNRIRNNNLMDNKIISKESDQVTIYFWNPTNEIPLFGIADNNYYARPTVDDYVFYTYQPSEGEDYRTLAGWQTFSGQDANSNNSPKTITDLNDLLFEYNATSLPVTVTLPFNCMDVTGATYNGTITLAPYTSAVLLKNGTANNQPPSIQNQNFSIAENSSNGTTAGTIIAADPDAGQTLTYSILSGNTSGAFAINASTGVLTVANSAALNFEVNPSFALVVKVQDNGTGTLSSQATVTVSLLNVNESPSINNQSFSIAENAANASAVGIVVASDPDAGQTLSYSILSGNTSGAFTINSSTGLLSVTNSTAINFEVNPSFILVIKVQDNGTSNLSSQATITISLLNVNETPVINNQTFSISENSANATVVGAVVAIDPDAGQTLSYSILSGNTSGAFAINFSTGIISVANSTAINFEVTPTFSLLVKVQDNGTGNLSSQATIAISLLNVNETPIINNQSFSILEYSANGTLIGTVVANDPDAGQTLTYSILSGNTSGAFTINPVNGVINVANSAALVFNVNPTFSIIVKVVDNGTGNLYNQASITINVVQATNQVPVIANQSFSIAENTANGTTVGTVAASDPDAGQTLTYSILSGNLNSAFSIDAATGVLSVSNSTAINFESTPLFALVVKVQDNGTGNLSNQATVTISLLNINEAPVIINQSFSISENSTNGTNVGTVVATDPDAGQTKTFTILSGNTSGAFAINPSTGMLTVASSTTINFEAIPTFALVVKVQDNGTGSLSSQATITISLLNVNEVPVINNQSFSIAENSINGSILGTVIATDPDAGQALSYSIFSGNTNGAFSINSSTGVLTVANSAALNFETIPFYGLVVKVQDNGTGNFSNQATISVSLLNANEAPIINDQLFSIAENSVNGTTVGTVTASDPDAGQTKTFTILSGNTNSTFSIAASSGVLTVVNSSALNFEITPTYNLVVKVQDNGTGNLSSQATVTVSLLDINESPVVDNQSFNVIEFAANGTSVGTVVATNPEPTQTLTYLITSGNISNAFLINTQSGEITVSNSTALDVNVNPSFSLSIKVTDNGTGNLFDEAVITILLLQPSNEIPIINNQSFEVVENSLNGTTIGSIIATDPNPEQALTYSILSGNLNEAFAIDAATGDLIVADSTSINYESTPSYALIVKVQDNGTGNLSSQALVTTSLIDENEAPIINNQLFAITENSTDGAYVGSVLATDPDAGQSLNYSIISGNTNDALSVNPTTGVITVANSTFINFEDNSTFELIIKVQDNGSDSLSDQASVSVSVLNTNEPPVILNQSLSVAENSADRTIVGNVLASDPDAGQILYYTILPGNNSDVFAINSATGVLTVNNSETLDFESVSAITLIVEVQDDGSGDLTNQATVTISLIDVNETPVVNDQSFSVAENSSNGTNVGTVAATDPDAGQTLTFSIFSGNTGGVFAINASTGVLTVATSTALNFEVNPSFALLVKVQDNGTGSLSSQAIVNVSLLNENEAPVINNQSFSVAENSSNGTTVGTVATTDPDVGQTLTFSIFSGNTGGAFAINASTGVLTVATSAALNFELNPTFTLLVKVQDNGTGSLTSQATVTVSLLNANEAPVISNQSFSVTENSTNGTTVGTVTAIDPDAGQSLTFSIFSGNTGGAFAINASTGVLTVANSTALNFELNPSFTLVVKVQDNGTGSLTSQATVTVSLLNANEAPVISNQSFSVAENSANGTTVGIVSATDPDAGQSLTFSIYSGNTGGAFAINASTGVLTVANSTTLNFELNPSFALVVKVQDNGTGSLTSQATVTVSILNANEAPVISNQFFSVAENSANGTTFGTVAATDQDAGQTLTFSILSGNTDGAFAINASTGVLTVANSTALNFELNPSFALVVKVQDNGTGSLSSQATVTVSLLNANEAPVINNQSFSVAENTANGTIVGTVAATDPDEGQTLTFSILSGNTDGAFAINASTGVLTVATSTALNFEVNPSFSLLVKVQDNGTGSLSSQATVTVSLFNANDAPVISNQSFSVAENSLNGTTVGTVAATDPDAGQTLTFSILSGNTSGAFAINASTGVLTVVTSSALNFELNPSFSMFVKVQDNGTGSLSSQATVTVSLLNANEAPVISNQSFSLTENSSNGTNVGTVAATDPDAGQTLTFSILSGNTGGAFTINASTGVLTVATSSALNFELNPSFSLFVKVQDNGSGSLSSQATVTVSLLNENEAPVINNQSFSVAENSANGTTVGTVAATDPDAGQTLTFSIFSGNTGGAFAINASTGVLTVANSTALNFESNPSFALVVKVQDNGTGSLTSQATVTVSILNANEAPVISNQSFSVAENSANGTTVGTVTATDPDAGQTLTFSIFSGNTDGAFAINASTGILTVANSTALNFELNPSFALVVKVQDNGTGSLTSQATVTVSLLNVNDAPVIINQSFSVAENSANGTTVGTVTATDPDAGQSLTFYIFSGNTGGAFAINASTGVLTVANSTALNFESNPSFALVVKVQDNGTGSLTSQATVTISVQNANEAPVISNQSFSVAENSANGTTVGTVTATDPDAGQTLTFSIFSGNTGGAFAINVSTGILTVTNSTVLNFELNPSFALVVKVQDNGTGNLYNQATILISVITSANQSPVINNQSFSITENSSNGTNIGTIEASDPDIGQTLTYSILSGNASGAFALDSITGILTISDSAAIDFETNSIFALAIKVQDNGSGNLSSQAIVSVSLFDVNEIPEISNQSFEIAENPASGTMVGIVVASDPDAGQTLSFSILSGNINGAFSINSLTGVLSIANSEVQDFETNPIFNLVIEVQDNGSGNLSNEALITISVQDANETPVLLNQSFSIVENSAIGTNVGTIIASDPDAGQILSYSILSGNTNGTFELNAISGVLSVANSSALNFETGSSFELVVSVQDNGTGNLSSQAIITITVQDENETPTLLNQSFSITENSANGTNVGTIVASDPDAGQILSYSILSGNTNGTFELNAISGVLSVANSSALNFETGSSFELVVSVQDNGTGNQSSQSVITISILDQNEAPVVNDQTFNVQEFAANGTLVGTILASEPDENQSLSYQITAGNVNNTFSINSITGELTISNSSTLDFDVIPTFSLLVTVTDNGVGNLSDNAIIFISVIPSSNQLPIISNQSFSITENSANGTYVDTIVASDPDAGQILSYSILSGNTNGTFELNAISGVLSVANSSALNFETGSSFELVVSVQDNGTGNLSSQAIITITVHDANETPTLLNQSFSIVENSAIGTNLGTIVASDPDAGQILSYSILSGNTNGAFELNTASGVLTVANSSALNFETGSAFALVVNVQDNGVGNLSSQAVITISIVDKNEAPVLDNQSFNVAEYSLNGTNVGTVTASDPDAAQLLVYSITSGNTSNTFSIDSLTGTILVADSTGLNYQTNPVFLLIIRVTDNGLNNLFDEANILINVLPGSNQPPVINDQSFSILENSINGSIVGIVEASDPNQGQSLTYSIEAGNIDGAFLINSLTGALTVGNSAALDFQVNPTFALAVKVQDNGSGILSSQAIITILLVQQSNEPPIIYNQTYSTFEHQPTGAIVCNIAASDPDSGLPLIYGITSGNIGNGFAINVNSGSLTINNPAAVCYEGNPVYSLTVKVQDNTGLTSEAFITIDVKDINEIPLCNNQSFTINENAPPQSIVGSIIAVEHDFNQTLTYSIVSGNINNTFSLNASDGLLKVENNSALNFDLYPQYVLTVSIQDNGLGNLTTFATITINLLDGNVPPLFENQEFTVMENSPTGTEIGILVAEDPDSGQKLTFTIAGGNETQTFTLNDSTGILTVADPSHLIYALNPVFILTVIVQDNGVDPLSTLSIITINLLQDSIGQIIYIDPTNENDQAENGTIIHPFDSWEDVKFIDGNTYLQKRGTTYRTDKSIVINRNSNITIGAYANGNNPVILNILPGINTLEFNRTQQISVSNLEIIANTKGIACIYITGEMSSNLTIDNCLLHEAIYGIRSDSKTENLLITNTTIYSTGLDGLNADDFASIEIAKCKIYDVNKNWFSNPFANGSCIKLGSELGKIHIHNNELNHSESGNMSVIRINGNSVYGVIESNTLKGRKSSGNQCLSLTNTSGEFVIRYNKIEGGEAGINFNAASGLLYYNLFTGNSVAIRVQKNKSVNIMNNTFYENEDYSLESLSGSKVNSVNNVYYLTHTATRAYKFDGTFRSNFNTFNIEKSGFLNGYSTLATWIAATGQDKNSFVSDPLFENLAEGNFRIKANSPCINKASDLRLEQDFFGTKVPQAGTPDIGFCEVASDSIHLEEEPNPLSNAKNQIVISVYPNPTSGIVTIDLGKVGDQQADIKILTMTGNVIYSSVVMGQELVVINLENEKPGFYLAAVTIAGEVYTRTLIVQ